MSDLIYYILNVYNLIKIVECKIFPKDIVIILSGYCIITIFFSRARNLTLKYNFTIKLQKNANLECKVIFQCKILSFEY